MSRGKTSKTFQRLVSESQGQNPAVPVLYVPCSTAWAVLRSRGGLLHLYLTEGIYQLVLERQLPHEIVNLFFCYYELKYWVDGFMGELTVQNFSIIHCVK